MGSGLVRLPSSYTVAETLDRVTDAAAALDFGVTARINHAQAAQKVGLELRPTEVLLVGNPKGGTALMLCAQTVAIDLPVKFLAYQDAAGQVWLTYNDPAYSDVAPQRQRLQRGVCQGGRRAEDDRHERSEVSRRSVVALEGGERLPGASPISV